MAGVIQARHFFIFGKGGVFTIHHICELANFIGARLKTRISSPNMVDFEVKGTNTTNDMIVIHSNGTVLQKEPGDEISVIWSCKVVENKPGE